MTSSGDHMNHEYYSPNLETAKHMQSTIEENCSHINNNTDTFVAADVNINLENKTKKDRHSKINTARGPRDRRMRLSVDVAKKFFKLQDMLGFDKASNTIQWLLLKSKSAIRDLPAAHLQISNTESCDQQVVVSGINDHHVEKNCIIRKDDQIRLYQTKETRAKARARARKRTTEKKSIKLITSNIIHEEEQNTKGSLDDQPNLVPFEEDQVKLADYPNNSYFQFQSKQRINFNVGDNSSCIMSTAWSPSFLFNFEHNFGPCHEHQFGDFQILGKPWEDIN